MLQQDSDTSRAKLAALYAFWKSRRGDRWLPPWSSFHPEEFKSWMPNLLVVGVEGPGLYRLRLVGTRVVEYDGADHTGRMLHEVVKEPTRPVVLRQFDDCVHGARPMAFRYRTSDFSRTPAAIDKIFLPVTDAAGGVCRVLVCFYLDFRAQESRRRPTIQDYEHEGTTVAYDPEMLLTPGGLGA
ncbi:PAS domain-containing protein [Arenibaculum pallidiluteum]|uniref:PAS domain-containing protein n=1 Tax=Arenibaculum pallidiluteum TaxID=2812559 RepID=UPI001A95F0E1|nr:PAS domain-containing protein [Arenibaculum pallidiluteum]